MRAAVYAALAALVLLTGLALILTFSNRRASFGGGSFAEIEHSIRAGGLRICSTVDRPDGQANQAVASRQYDVAVDCGSGDTARVVADEFGSQAARDAAVRNAEVQVRPAANGVSFTHGRFSLFVFGPSDDAVQDRLGSIFRRTGAE